MLKGIAKAFQVVQCGRTRISDQKMLPLRWLGIFLQGWENPFWGIVWSCVPWRYKYLRSSQKILESFWLNRGSFKAFNLARWIQILLPKSVKFGIKLLKSSTGLWHLLNTLAAIELCRVTGDFKHSASDRLKKGRVCARVLVSSLIHPAAVLHHAWTGVWRQTLVPEVLHFK